MAGGVLAAPAAAGGGLFAGGRVITGGVTTGGVAALPAVPGFAALAPAATFVLARPAVVAGNMLLLIALGDVAGCVSGEPQAAMPLAHTAVSPTNAKRRCIGASLPRYPVRTGMLSIPLADAWKDRAQG
jgi:hypothetical protein